MMPLKAMIDDHNPPIQSLEASRPEIPQKVSQGLPFRSVEKVSKKTLNTGFHACLTLFPGPWELFVIPE